MSTLDRQMKRLVDQWGEEPVRAWVHANCTTYAASKRSSNLSRPNKKMYQRSGVLLDRKHPETQVDAVAPTPDSDDEEPPVRKRPAGRGVLSNLLGH